MGVFDRLAAYEAEHGVEPREESRNLAAEIIDTPQWEESDKLNDND